MSGSSEAEIDAAKSYLDEAATFAGRDLTPRVVVAGMLEAAARVLQKSHGERLTLTTSLPTEPQS